MSSAAIAVESLRREWREQRDTLLKLAVVTPVLVGIVTFALLYHGEKSRDTVGSSALCALLLAYAGLCPGMIASEIERGRLTFLARTPRALGAAFLSKLAVLFAAPLAIGVLGAVCAYAFRIAFVSGAQAPQWERWIAELGVLGAFVAVWTLPCGVLVRTSLVLPMGLLAGAALCFGLVRVGASNFGNGTLIMLPTAGVSVLATWFALVHGRARGRSRVRVAAWAMVPYAAVVLFLCGWMEAAPTSKQKSLSAPRYSDRTYLDQAFLSAEGRTLYVNVVRKGSDRYEAFVLVVATGEVLRQDRRTSYHNLGTFDRTEFLSGIFGRHTLLVRIYDDASGREVFEADTGTVLGVRDRRPGEAQDFELEGWMRRAKRESTPWRDARGRPTWLHFQVWESANDAGELERNAVPPGTTCFSIGWRMLVTGPGRDVNSGWDVLRGRHVDLPSRKHSYVGCLPQGWLFLHAGAWELTDPETSTVRNRIVPKEHEIILMPLPEGRLLVSEGSSLFDRTGPKILVDPATGERTPLEVRGAAPHEIGGIGGAGHMFAPALDAHGRHIVSLHIGKLPRLGRLDVAAATLHVLPNVGNTHEHSVLEAIGMLGDDELLVLEDHQRIVRASFANGSRHVLYEVEEP